MQISRRTLAASVGALGVSALLASCSGAAGSPAPAPSAGDGTGKVRFWAWAAGLDTIVKKFNAMQSDITVELNSSASGDTAYKRLQSAVDSGTGPDLAQVEYFQIPSLAITGTLQNVAKLTAQYESNFLPTTWQAAGFQGQHFGIPNDQGPLVLYYNSELLGRAGVEAPTTWEQFREAAVAVKKATGARMATLLQAYTFIAALAQQAGAQWFAIDGDKWKVTVNDQATRDLLDFWISMANEGLVTVNPGFNSGFWQELDAAACATYPVGVWGYRGMKGNLSRSSGKWRVATAPQWKSSDSNGNHGGSTWAITKNSSNIAAALKFANWLASDPEAMNLQYDNSGYYPASAKPSAVTGYSKPDPFFGGQEVGTTFQKAASQVKPGWQWGPQMSELSAMMQDRLPAAIAAGNSRAYLDGVQKDFVATLKGRGLSVVER